MFVFFDPYFFWVILWLRCCYLPCWSVFISKICVYSINRSMVKWCFKMTIHLSLTYCIPLVRDQSRFYKICSLAICINIKAFNCVNRKQFKILKNLWNIWKIILLLTEDEPPCPILKLRRKGREWLSDFGKLPNRERELEKLKF